MTTHWSAIVTATTPTPGSETALRELCQTYWSPLYAFVRRRGFSAPEAEDLTQAFFARFLSGHYLTRADPDRGRFRSFLVSCLENFLRNEWRRQKAQKRGGDARWVPLEFDEVERGLARGSGESESPEVTYARQWARTLLDRVFTRLQAEWAVAERQPLFEELQSHLWGDPTAIPYADLAPRFGMTPVNLRVTLHRLRQRFRDVLRELVAQTVADPAEIDDELQFLLKVVSQ